ncbi:hypothetical protein G5714_014499 [Onychostoma macrolepis]|uniref:Cadherin domain-containing protein n=1 Tax=Onychostoma macrolepis TaxID=369639 RepID=A0A7J6CCZ4_9TELE|nr:hypothetical protein G5714_014499 [Onychostoma macrolepis]
MSRDESSSKLTFYLIIALVSVSTFFLTFIIIILAVRFCRRRKPRLLFDGAVAIPSAYLPPNYAEVEGAGTLRSTYNYDAYLTTGSRTSDFKFIRSYNEGTLTADLTLKKTQSAVDDLEGLDAEMSDAFQILYPSPEGNSFMTEMVPKAAQARSLVSKVIAVDADSGQNAWLSYHIIKATDPGLFTIGVHSGEIRTQRDISESDSMKQNLIVSVRDNGQPSLSATCALYLLISDNLAEVPELKDMSRDESSSKLTFYLIIALVSVSTFFLTFIIIILAVRFCRRRKPRLLFDGAVAIPSAYLLQITQSDFKFIRSYNEGTLTADLTLKKTQSAVDDLEGLDAEMSDAFQILYPSPEGNSFMTEMVPKAAQASSLVSKVIAVDADSGQNAWLSYHIIKATDPGLFTIGVHSGEIRTQRDISESDSMKQNLIVSVRDNGQPSLSATCVLYLLISDNLAEVPELKDMSHDESSSKLTFYLIIALVSVSTFFLTFIIIILAVRFCRRRKPRLLFDGAVAIPSAYLPPNYAEVEGAGTLRSTYNYDAYLTTGSRTSDFKFIRSYNEGTLTADLTLKKTQSAVDDLEGLDAEMLDSFQILYPSPEGNSFMTEMVPKAAQARSLVSKVIAVDADSGQNAWLSYHVIKATDPGLFAIGVHSGEIRTQRDISESDSMKQNLIVSVRDNGQPSLSATCALYLLISDNLAEVPELKDMSRDESSSKLTFYLIIALVSVSTFFLTFIIIILAVRFCRRRKPRLLFDGAVAIPSAYLPPNYAEVEGAGTLRSTYNYDAYLTTGSRTSDFKFIRSYNEGTLTADLTLKKTQSAVDDLEGLDAEMNDSFQVGLKITF